MSQRKHINWTNTLFLILSPLVGVVGTVLLCVFSHIGWQTWTLMGVMLVLGGMSITSGYHRLFSHKTYTASWPIQLLFVLFGSANFEGSVLEWSTDHRNHHRYTDTEKDPYNIKQGFWHAHLGWLIHLNPNKRDFSNVDDLNESALLRFQNRYFVIIAAVMGFVVPTAIASLWGAPLAGFIVAGALRVTIAHHGTFCINSLCHILGKRPYSDRTTARDNWLSALVTFGEGYHNYHHQFPLDYRNGVRLYHFDPSKWLVRGLSFVGLTSNLRRIPKYRIIQARIEMHKKAMAARPHHPLQEHLYESMMQVIASIKSFEKAYAESPLKAYRVKLKHARHELGKLLHAWNRTLHRATENL